MKKNSKNCFCFMLFLLCINTINAQVRSFEVDGINYRVVKEPSGSMSTGTVSVCPIEYGEYEGDIVIPNSVKETNDQYADKYKVVGIDAEAFAETKYLKSVKIPASIESIGDYAFRYSSIEKVELPMGNLETIGKSVFAQTRLDSIEIPSTIKVIGESAFGNCKKLSKIIIHEGLTTIESEAFYGCDNIESMQFPNSLKVIGDDAFRSCYKLAKVSFGNNIKRIGDRAFGDCIRMRTLELPKSIREIGVKAFAGSGIVETSIPETIKIIKEGCFSNSMLRRITLPSTLTAIEDFAFSCHIDTLIVSTNTLVSDKAKMTYSELMAKSGYSLSRGSFYIPEHGKDLDYLLSKLEANVNKKDNLIVEYSNIVFSKGRIKVGDLVYEPVSYPISNEEYGSVVLVEGKSASGSVHIPEVLEIVGGPYPEKYIVAGISDGAFDGNKNVLSVDIPASVSAFGIGMSVFRGTSIVGFELPNSIEAIPSGAFSGTNLSKIIIPKGVKVIGSYAFSNTKLKEIVIPEGVTVIEANTFSGCKQLSSVTLPSTVKKIGRDAFSNCPLSQIILPDAIEEIGYSSFSNCKIERLRIPSGLKIIDKAAFNCDNLISVEICGNPCEWIFDNGGVYNHIFGNNPQLKIFINNAKYAACPVLEMYSDRITIAGQKNSSINVSNAEYVDLGLPSGTLWATCNVGASKPEDYGDYYAWGEIKGIKDGKKKYDAENHKYLLVEGWNLTEKKYCLNDRLGKVDSLYKLLPEDDVATVKKGKKWRMPTKAEMEELIKECSWSWLNYSDDVSGYLVTGPNGNSIFLPAAGYHDDISDGNDVAGLNSSFYYWTNERNGLDALALNKYGVKKGELESTSRWRGCSVRAVRVK